MKLIVIEKHFLKAIKAFKKNGHKDITTCCPVWQAFHEKTRKIEFSVALNSISKGNDVIYNIEPELPDELYTSDGWDRAALKAPYVFNLIEAK